MKKIAIGLCAFIAWAFIVKVQIDGEEKFVQSCTENKGIAVRDIDNKMRCVPMLGKANND